MKIVTEKKVKNKDYWKTFWNAHAMSDDNYGRDTWSFADFYILINDVVTALDLKKSDIVLDAGGGAGRMSIAISPFVKKITLFDFGNDIVEKARKETRFLKNIEVLKDDICIFGNITSGYTKAIVGSVLQYLNDYKDVEIILTNLFNVLRKEGRVVFTHNPDLSKKDQHIESYKRLAWDKERIEKSLAIEEQRLWIDKEKFVKISRKVGFSKSHECPINPILWQSTHMFDWLVIK